jgi:hypothetical protein
MLGTGDGRAGARLVQPRGYAWDGWQLRRKGRHWRCRRVARIIRETRRRKGLGRLQRRRRERMGGGIREVWDSQIGARGIALAVAGAQVGEHVRGWRHGRREVSSTRAVVSPRCFGRGRGSPRLVAWERWTSECSWRLAARPCTGRDHDQAAVAGFSWRRYQKCRGCFRRCTGSEC